MSSDSAGDPPDPGINNKLLGYDTNGKAIIDDAMEIDRNESGSIQKNKKTSEENVSNVNLSKFFNNITQTNKKAVITKTTKNCETYNTTTNGNKKTEIPKRETYVFKPTDTGPYSVYIENNNENFSGKLSAMKIGEIIYKCHPEINNQIKTIDSVARNRIRVTCKEYNSANLLVKSLKLKEFHMNVFIPRFMLHRRGIIRGVDLEYSDEYIKQNIKEHDLHCKFSIDSVKRLSRKEITQDQPDKYVPTKTVLVTFKSQNLPKYIEINHVIFAVETYIEKVVLCYNCYRYGHLGKHCKSAPRCLKCKRNHQTNACLEATSPQCFYCNGSHFTNAVTECPEFKRQKEIKKLMAQTNLSYKDASEKTPKHTYADTLKTNPIPNPKQMPHPIHESSNNPKRLRVKTPDPFLEAHKRIVTPINLPSTPGGIIKSLAYTSNLNQEKDMEDSIQKIMNTPLFKEIIETVIEKMKEINSFDLQELDLFSIFKNKLSENLHTSVFPS